MKQPVSMMNPILAPIAVWLYGLMVVVAPPTRPQYEPVAMESVAQAQERYRGISEAIAKVAYDPAEQPINGSRTFTAALLASIAFHESGFRRDVDLGLGRAKLAKSGWNDFGRSWCMMQINLGTRNIQDDKGQWKEESASQTEDGYWGSELLADREKCFRAGLHVIRRTWGCKGGTLSDALSKYAGGECFTAADESKAKEEGNDKLLGKIKASRFASANRVQRALKWSKTRPKDWKDSEVVKALLAPPEARQPPAPTAQDVSGGSPTSHASLLEK